MLFDEDFLNTLANDPIAGTIQICNTVINSIAYGHDWSERDCQNFVEAYTLLSEMQAAEILPVDHTFSIFPSSVSLERKTGVMNASILEIRKKCDEINEAANVEKLRKKFRTALSSGFKYEFSQGDLERVQKLINELRQEVSGCDDLEDGHKTRVLKRLESLQSEVHKKMSDIDKFFGLVSDASVILAKIGNDAKPIVDRVRELADIVLRTQTRAEELPSGTPLPQIGHSQTKQLPGIEI